MCLFSLRAKKTLLLLQRRNQGHLAKSKMEGFITKLTTKSCYLLFQSFSSLISVGVFFFPFFCLYLHFLISIVSVEWHQFLTINIGKSLSYFELKLPLPRIIFLRLISCRSMSIIRPCYKQTCVHTYHKYQTCLHSTHIDIIVSSIIMVYH